MKARRYDIDREGMKRSDNPGEYVLAEDYEKALELLRDLHDFSAGPARYRDLLRYDQTKQKAIKLLRAEGK